MEPLDWAGLRQGADRMRATTARERLRRLDRLYTEVVRRREDLVQAVWADFRKPAEEFDLTEIYMLKSEIAEARRRLRGWMQPRRVPVGLAGLGASSWVRREGKGVVLIVAPWNYPMQLLFRPLVSAIAAGCAAVLKPSEWTPETARVMEEIVHAACDPQEVQIRRGGVEVSQALLALPFDHIYFTGSPAVGKLVMEAAAKHPCSVTLELGGKSPVIIDETADLGRAARRLAWAKLTNAGQICVAPDHVYVHESVAERFLTMLLQEMRALHPGGAEASPDYPRIVAPHHARRIASAVDEAVQAGARVILGGPADPDACYIPPTVLTDLPPGVRLLEDEIFGPVLPVLRYTDPDALTAHLRTLPNPLALYLFSRSRRNIRRLLDSTRSGGVGINQAVVHVASTGLPFGGWGLSGVGSGHGEYGFQAFTHDRAVFQQVFPGASELLQPPFTPWKRRLIAAILRWL